MAKHMSMYITSTHSASICAGLEKLKSVEFKIEEVAVSSKNTLLSSDKQLRTTFSLPRNCGWIGAW
jgi:hypothetical protein